MRTMCLASIWSDVERIDSDSLGILAHWMDGEVDDDLSKCFKQSITRYRYVTLRYAIPLYTARNSMRSIGEVY